MQRSLLALAAGTVVALAATAACATPTDAPAPTSSPVSQSPPAGQATAPGVSPGGVTTAVDAPAESTEDDYFQACLAAKTWMDQQGGDPRSQIEPYLKTLQTQPTAGPATFGTPWPELSPGRQAAVIVAVEAAADALCG
ncbi:hypothetical protein MPNTM1_02578 [Mycolicibacterium parafortuitum]|uniref:lipoprotein LpqV n=1 Tax=Mycolicibacterium parafortuitum TaxID=39692 RepID=UPI0032C3FF0F